MPLTAHENSLATSAPEVCVGDLLRCVLGISNKSAAFALESEEEMSARITDVKFNKGPYYFWLNFKLKREQEITVKSMLMNQDVLVALPTTYRKS